MGKFWLKAWLYTKITFFALIVIYIFAFAVINDKPEKIWISYHKEIDTSTLMLASVAFICGVVCTVLIRTTLVTMRQFRQVKERNRHERLHRDVEEMKARTVQPAPERLAIQKVKLDADAESLSISFRITGRL